MKECDGCVKYGFIYVRLRARLNKHIFRSDGAKKGKVMKVRFPVKLHRSRSALLAVAAATASMLAMAQQEGPTSEVRVQASAVIKKQVGKTSSGVPIETAEVTMRVAFADLALDTNSGQALLKSRVADAAKDACERINTSYAPGTPGTSDAECVNTAIKNAKPQVDAVIAAANAHKSGVR